MKTATLPLWKWSILVRPIVHVFQKPSPLVPTLQNSVMVQHLQQPMSYSTGIQMKENKLTVSLLPSWAKRLPVMVLVVTI